MGKSEGDSDRKLVYVSIGLSLGVCLVLAGVISFFVLRSDREIANLHTKVNGLTQEINTLRHQLRQLNNTVIALDSKETSVQKNNGEEYDYVEDYDDPNENYDDEEAYNDSPAPAPNLNSAPVPAPLTQSAKDNKNDTRPKRESTSKTFTKEIIHPSKVYNSFLTHEIKSLEQDIGSISSLNYQKLMPKETIDSRYTPTTHHPVEESDKIPSHPKVKKKRHLKVLTSDLQTTDQMHRYKRGGRQEDVEVFTRTEFPTRNGGHTETVAAHYGADESKCKNTRHRHCDHNDRRFHPEKKIKDWQSSSWMNLLSATSSFEMINGVLVVQNSGLYFIYAQVFYADTHDVSGFRILQNDLPILQCTTTSVHDPTKHMHKRNSCFTGGLVHLKRGDELILRETEEDRYTVFERTKSFFGLFKVGNV